jgi:acetoin utilization deacetylase AcuC-like enzyme
MSTIIVQHDDCFHHDPGPNHPESPRRIKAILSGLENLKSLEKLPAPQVTVDQIRAVHPVDFWTGIQQQEPAEGRIAIDADTFLNCGSIDAALRASGGLCFAIDQLLADKALRAFCAVRPPGHHSEPERAMGFCLLNHVAIGALHALENPSVERVAIIDFDVHHGNGTQAVFEENPDVLFISSHQMPLYPGTGSVEETGCGNILNLPLAPGDGGKAFRRTWDRKGLPAVHDFAPDLILVSAGFDAHQRDPLAQLELEDADYRWITEEICDLSKDCSQGRVASILEGGYDLKALASAGREHVLGLGC